MEVASEISGYRYEDGELNTSHSYLVPGVLNVLAQHEAAGGGRRLFDLGCGNGSVTDVLSKRGYAVAGVDVSVEGINRAKETYPHLRLELGSAYDDLGAKFGRFNVVVSLEVVEHVYAPRKYARTVYELLEPSGIAIISTPYHGYIKNLALAATGALDKHFTALWDHGHIKFWSISTLSALLKEAGFREVHFLRVGRIPPLAKSMIAVARK